MVAGMTALNELDTAIKRAVSALDTAIIENRLSDDPLRLVLVGLIQTLKAQRQLYAAADRDLSAHLEQARRPVEDEALRRAVVMGVGTYAWHTVRTIRVGIAAA